MEFVSRSLRPEPLFHSGRAQGVAVEHSIQHLQIDYFFSKVKEDSFIQELDFKTIQKQYKVTIRNFIVT